MSIEDEYVPPPHLSRWPHRLAVLLACATFPLIWVGGLVTTYDAGMAVPDWPTTYGYNLFLYPWQTWVGGPWDLFIEHGHRLLGAFVGVVTLVMAAAVWRCEPRRWVRWFAVACVVGVIAQGILGGMRVLLDERQLAMIHGCTGPLFFCLAVSMATITSPRWRPFGETEPSTAPLESAGVSVPLAALAWLVTALAFAQIVVGAQLRHITSMTSHAAFRIALFFHIGIGIALFLHVIYLAISILRGGRQSPARGRFVVSRLPSVCSSRCRLHLAPAVGSLSMAFPAGSRTLALPRATP